MKNVLISFLITSTLMSFGQTDTLALLQKRLAKKHVTYYYVGKNCPTFIDTENKYGFKIRCTGCLMTLRIKYHNKRAKRKIGKVYGAKWFETNFKYFRVNSH